MTLRPEGTAVDAVLEAVLVGTSGAVLVLSTGDIADVITDEGVTHLFVADAAQSTGLDTSEFDELRSVVDVTTV